NIYSILRIFMNIVEQSICRNDFKIRQGTILELLTKASEILEDKLPDQNNINHDGYKTVCYSLFSRFKGTNVKKQIKNQLPDFDKLYKTVEKIPNISDKIFVLTKLSSDSYSFDINFSLKCIREAEQLLESITNYVDKIERTEQVIETYQFINQNDTAEFLLNNIFEFVKIRKDSHDLERNLEQLIELAHKINPELAHQLAKDIDSPNQKKEVQRTLKALDLHVNPHKISDSKKIDETSLKNFYIKTIKSLNSGRGIAQNEELIINSISKSTIQDTEAIMLSINWYIENTIRRNGTAKISNLSDLFVSIKDTTDFTIITDSSVINLEKIKPQLQEIAHLISDQKSHVFKHGNGDKAKEYIVEWINNNSQDSLIIYDPYFSENELDLFMELNIRENIYVITTLDSQKKSVTRDGLISNFSSAWRKICDQTPPIIDFIVLCSENRKTPLHDRYIIGDNCGIKYGVSFNGMNSNDFTIEQLDETDTLNIRNEMIFPIIFSPPKIFGENKVTTYKFQI
ncbi:hypothetical protein NXZ75_22240, partial [Lysinibacillus sphaericus]|uniref:hypothetical protein n=1 Tax=Lysinibacillus sphaericus TaxID=1421 RepID=UPI00216333C4